MEDALCARRVRLCREVYWSRPVRSISPSGIAARSWGMRQRFRMALSLLPSSVGRLLEVGYGSGVFMPELARRAQELFGIDIHDHHEEVARALASINITARLHKGSAEAMPFGDGIFDAIGVVRNSSPISLTRSTSSFAFSLQAVFWYSSPPLTRRSPMRACACSPEEGPKPISKGGDRE